jgi:hypothetical protein
MADKIKISLQDGTLVRHRTQGYQGRIEGITQIKACFTKGGAALALALAKETFQYRVAVKGESMRHIAPAEDLEVVEEEQVVHISCFNCGSSFRSKPGVSGKPGGRCECGGWICPACLACQVSNDGNGCAEQRKRLVKKHAKGKKRQSARVQ